jgi:putative oxidoreductase
MDQWTALYAPLIGRILVGGYFVWSGVQKIVNFDSLVGYLANAGFPYPTYCALAMVTIETIAGILLVVDLQTRVTALWLAVYLLVSSSLFFSVTTVMQTQIFLANTAIVGGLLVIAGAGSSRWSPSIAARRSRR